MALPATVGSGLSWSDHLSNRHGPLQPHPSIAEYYATLAAGGLIVGNASTAMYRGQTFLTTAAGDVTQVVLYLNRGGTTNRQYAVEIYATSGGLPTGSALASQTLESLSISNSGAGVPVTIRFATPVSLATGTTYALVLRPTTIAVDTTNYLSWYDAATASYASGTGLAYNNTTTTWSTNAFDHLFRIEIDSPNLYVVALDKINNHVEVWKSTDSGQTWAEVDAANHKTVSSSAGSRCADADIVGTTITIAYITGASTYSFCDFNTNTDTWGTPVNSTAGSTLVADATGNKPLFVARLNNGDTNIWRVGDYTNMTLWRAIFTDRYVSGTWTNGHQFSALTQDHYEPFEVMTNGVLQLMVYGVVALDDVYIKARTAAYANGSSATVDSAAHATSLYLSGHGCYDDTEFNVTVIDSTNELDNVRYTVSSAGAITFVSPVAAISATSTTNPEASTHSHALVNIGGTIHAFWIADNQTSIYRDNDAGTNTWGTDTSWKSGLGTLTSINARPVAIGGSSVGILYLEGGTITYDSYPQSTLGGTTHQASGSASATFAGSANSRKLLRDSGSASFLIAGVADGRKLLRDSGSAAIVTTGTAAARKTSRGSGSAAILLDGIAASAVRFRAAGLGAIALNGTASPLRYIRGSGGASSFFAGSANARKILQDSGAASLILAGSAASRKILQGSGSSLATFAGIAAGRAFLRGVGSAQALIAGAANGRRTQRGSGSAVLILTGVASARYKAAASGYAPIIFAGTASTSGNSPASGGAQIFLSGLASSRVILGGSGSASLSLSGTAEARRTQRAAGSATVVMSGLATALRRMFGSGSGAIIIGGISASRLTARASGSSLIQFDGAGVVPGGGIKQGSGGASIFFNAVASAVRIKRGSGESTFSIEGVAEARRILTDSGQAIIIFDAEANPIAIYRASGSAEIIFDGSAEYAIPYFNPLILAGDIIDTSLSESSIRIGSKSMTPARTSPPARRVETPRLSKY
jgi:hypothetical protein